MLIDLASELFKGIAASLGLVFRHGTHTPLHFSVCFRLLARSIILIHGVPKPLPFIEHASSPLLEPSNLNGCRNPNNTRGSKGASYPMFETHFSGRRLLAACAIRHA